jgi:hypothetical protein
MDQANKRRVHRLDEIDAQETRRFLEEEYGVRHQEDYVLEMPQSGERFRGRENVRAFQEAYPTPPHGVRIRLRRVIVEEGLWVAEGDADYGDGLEFKIALGRVEGRAI